MKKNKTIITVKDIKENQLQGNRFIKVGDDFGKRKKMRILFHLKWLFKKRYQIVFSFDPAIINKENIVCVKHDKKYNKIKVIR